mmetsp:Transcript_47658/g.123581  ORF Transcript_47658/g.123581 Transcript_47658/m.123581 type:complete len:271 (-) Transcript_47658:28-840(-)
MTELFSSLCTVVVCELQNGVEHPFHEVKCFLRSLISRQSCPLLFCHGGQKIEGKLGVWKVLLRHQCHTKEVGIEWDRFGGVFHSQHGLRQIVSFNASTCISPDNLDPVPIRIQSKRQALHSALIGPLSEPYPSLFQLSRGLVHIISEKSDVAKPVWVVFVLVFTLVPNVNRGGGVVVCELQRYTLEVPQVIVCSIRTRCKTVLLSRGKIGKKVEGKIHRFEVVLVDEGHVEVLFVEVDGLGWVSYPHHGLLPGEIMGRVKGSHNARHRLL